LDRGYADFYEKALFEFAARWLWEACRILKLEGTP